MWACGAIVGCADEPSAVDLEWIDLAREFVPETSSPALGEAGPSRRLGEGTTRWQPVAPIRGRSGGWVTETISAGAWEEVHPRIWHAETEWSKESHGYSELSVEVVRARSRNTEPEVFKTFGKNVSGERLAEEGADFGALFEVTKAMLGGEDPAGRFLTHGRDLWLILGEQDEPGDGVTVRTWVDLGQPGQGGWRVFSGPCSGRGMVLLPGSPESVETRVPPDSVLRFEPLPGPGEGPGPLRISLDEEVIFEQNVSAEESYALSLPEEGRPGARLTFEFLAKAGRLALLEPIIGPKEIGTYAERPWRRTRPDLVLVSVDTYRADNLAHNGGDPRWAPNLNRLADQSLCFTDARSPATWTLPAHAALFTGRMPHQLDMHKRGARLSGDVQTIAGRFTEAGYRVAAITERGFVSRAYGIDQGFGRFEEHNANQLRTLEGVAGALARDDGRPLLLLIHSYRAHDPYVASAETREALSISDSAPTPQTLLRWRNQLVLGDPATGEVGESMAGLRHLYRGSSRDMDTLFGQFMNEFERAGILGSGYLAVFSDHGESFGEHGVIGHGAGVWEEEARVPLMLSGPGIPPELRAGPASLIDLPRTLASLARIDPSPQWAGVNLLAGNSPRPVAVFQCGTYGTDHIAVVDGGRKIIMPFDKKSRKPGPIAFAYDLFGDPGELKPVDPTGDWPAVLDERLRPVLERLSRTQSAAESAGIDSAHAEELRAMGYAGDY